MDLQLGNLVSSEKKTEIDTPSGIALVSDVCMTNENHLFNSNKFSKSSQTFSKIQSQNRCIEQ